jgi:hypothetical protein
MLRPTVKWILANRVLLEIIILSRAAWNGSGSGCEALENRNHYAETRGGC